MPENANGGEKTEQPTPRRIEEARNEGQVALSTEVNTALLLLVGLSALAFLGPGFCQAAAESIRYGITEGLTHDLENGGALRELFIAGAPMGLWLLPLLGILLLTALVAGLVQVGFHLSGKALLPKVERISPITGFSRLFGLRGLMRFVVNLFKLATVLIVAWLVLAREIPRIGWLGPDLGMRLAHDARIILWLGLVIVAILLLIAVGDLIYQRWQHLRDLMMTKQELKEELKQSEGDPHIKGKIRQIQRQMAQRRMMQEVPKADVVITNPTHVAVALRYDAADMAAPLVVAKGYDEVAQRIKEIAREHRIVMVENVALARALARECEVGKPIKVKWFQAVAEVLAMVYRLRKAA